MRCVCCGMSLLAAGGCPACDAVLSSPPHVCLRWLKIIGDDDGCEPAFARLSDDHETAWRPDRLDVPVQGGAEP